MLINLSLCPALLLAYPRFFIGGCVPVGWFSALKSRCFGQRRRLSQSIYEDEEESTALLPPSGLNTSIDSGDGLRTPGRSGSRVDAYWLWVANQTQRPSVSLAVIIIVVAIVASVGSSAFSPPISATTDAYLPRGSKVTKAIDTMSESFNPGSTYPYQIIIEADDKYGPDGVLNTSFMIDACHMLQRLANDSTPNPILPSGTTIVTYFFVPAINLSSYSPILDELDCALLAAFVTTPNPGYEGQILADKLLIDSMVKDLYTNRDKTAAIAEVLLGVNPMGAEAREWISSFRQALAQESAELGLPMWVAGFGADIADSIDGVYG